MIVTAVVLAIIAAIVQSIWGIPDPWQKVILAGIVVLFVVGLVVLLVPGGLSFGRI